MLRINNFQSLRGGDFADYTAPDLEMLLLDVEQGFAGSTWDSAIEQKRTWSYTNEDELFQQ